MTDRDTAAPRSTPLGALHLRQGARMGEFAGYALPLRYGAGIIAEHNAVRNRAGLFDVSHMGQIAVEGSDAARLIAKAHPSIDAALCFNDLIALGMAAGFAEQGVAVGKEFRLAGFDDLEESAQALPPLTSVSCHIGGFGRRVARDLLRWLLDGERPTPEYRARMKLIARASTLGRPCDSV